MGSSASLVVTVPEERGDVPSDAFLDAVRAARESGRKKATVRCHSEWSWLMAATLLRDAVEEVEWQRTAFAPSTNNSAMARAVRAAADVAGTAPDAAAAGGVGTAIVLLGNLPINPTTMTVDSYARMQKAADVYAAAARAEDGGRATVICCGGHSLYTFNGNKYREQEGYPSCLSEAQMMAAWLLLTGQVPRCDLILEDTSMTTCENGKFASAVIARLGAREVVLVSKEAHLAWAKELYVGFPTLVAARLEGAVVDKSALMAQLRRHAELGDSFAATRLQYLRDGETGLD